jgi:hypothetical protein
MQLKQSYCFATRSKGSAAWTRSSFQLASVEKFSFLGIELNELRNADTAELIFSDASQFNFSVLRTDEELMIARSVWRIRRTALERAELMIEGAVT